MNGYSRAGTLKIASPDSSAPLPRFNPKTPVFGAHTWLTLPREEPILAEAMPVAMTTVMITTAVCVALAWLGVVPVNPFWL